jgi:CHAD domain-containing protein
MPESYEERELKFDVNPDFVVPDVADLLPDGGRIETGSEQLHSYYFDTADRALLRNGMTLRRRRGSTDNGWQLKVPREPFREEIRVKDIGDRVPDELSALLLGVVRGRPLAQISSMTTDRAVTRLLDGTGTKLAEIDDDVVHASAAGNAATGHAATVSSWREVEVELGRAELDLLYAVGKRLKRAGARPSVSRSKLARALPRAATPNLVEHKPRAGDVVAAYIAEQQQVILAGDVALRRGDESAIHKTRVATRRFRSSLRVFGVLFEPSRAAALDGELRWFAALLGAVRDRQVLLNRLDRMLGELDDTLLLGPVRARVDTELRQELAEHWATMLHEMTGDRYLTLLADVDNWVQQPPQTAEADSSPRLIAKLLSRAERKVSRRLAKANEAGDIHLLHGARKAAKRARYAAEAARPVIGRKAAARHAKRYEELQDLLGEHQDSLVSAELLRRLGTKAGDTVGENGFTFGILYERELENARVARDKAQRVAKQYR